MASLIYHSAYTGEVVEQNGLFDHFVRKVNEGHTQNGAWLFAAKTDEQLAFLRGFYNPEAILDAVANGRGKLSHEDINILWTPGQNDPNMVRAIVATPATHLYYIFNSRQYLGMALSSRDQTPLYPIDPRMRAYWERTQIGQTSPRQLTNSPSQRQPVKATSQEASAPRSVTEADNERHHEASDRDQKNGKNNQQSNAQCKGLQPKPARTGSRGYTSEKPRCKRCIKLKKGCDRRRPCQNCAGLAECISEDERVLKKQPSSRKARKEPKDNAERGSQHLSIVAADMIASNSLQQPPSEDTPSARLLKAIDQYSQAPAQPASLLAEPLEQRTQSGPLSLNLEKDLKVSTTIPEKLDRSSEPAIGTTFIRHSFIGGVAVRGTREEYNMRNSGAHVISRVHSMTGTDISQIEFRPTQTGNLTSSNVQPSRSPIPEKAELSSGSSINSDRTVQESQVAGTRMSIADAPTAIHIYNDPEPNPNSQDCGFGTQDISASTEACIDVDMLDNSVVKLQSNNLDVNTVLDNASVPSIEFADFDFFNLDDLTQLPNFDVDKTITSEPFADFHSMSGALSEPPYISTDRQRIVVCQDNPIQNEQTESDPSLYYMHLPCMDCGEEKEHSSVCHIGKIKPMNNLTALDYRNLADASKILNVYKPMDITQPEVPPGYFAWREDPEAQIKGMAETIRNEESYQNDTVLHDLPDDTMILLWALKTSSNVEVIGEDIDWHAVDENISPQDNNRL